MRHLVFQAVSGTVALRWLYAKDDHINITYSYGFDFQIKACWVWEKTTGESYHIFAADVFIPASLVA